MLSKLCRKHNVRSKSGSGVWTTVPCCSIFKQSLDKRKSSLMHQTAEEMELSLKLAEKTGGVQEALSQQVNLQRTAFVTALRLLYWLAKEEVAHTTKFPSLVKLVQQCGVSHLEHLRVGDNAFYQSETALQEMLENLAEVTSSEIYEAMQSSPFFSILCDETTDVSVLSQLIFYGRFLDNQGQVQTKFLAIKDIPNGTAETVTNNINMFMDDNKLERSKFVGFGSDGASVMVGSQTGRVTKDPIFKVAQAKDVRWLSHQKAVDTVRQCLPSLLISLEREAAERGDPKAVGLASFMKTYNFAATVSMLSDVLPHLTRLSLLFQKTNVDFTVVDTVVHATIAAVEHLRDHYGQHMTALSAFVEKLRSEGVTVPLNAHQQFIEQVYNPYITNVMTNLQDRFPDTGLLKNFSCFDFTSAD
ncbi:uncharacterized protein LOC119743514 isoform X1 [Patiria miniata]|uniref:DUF4371 domain-containing protein n=1 Tax=Patiria miniata TaxID=46514 RepID=A0A914BJ58_PATMI|nr:uncharacterized protein LOC119743514 isoform X1 [Patiria miniata]